MSDDTASLPFLPYGKQTIEADDIAAIAKAICDEYLTTGPTVTQFDEAFAEITSARFAASCNSGTAALHLAMLALDIGPDDTVIVPSLTFLASANAARFQGARVIFADVDSRTGLLTPETLREALVRAGGNARAVVAVHLNGQCADMPALAAIARSAGMAIVEDACHALGAHQIGPDGTEYPVGACSFSDLACFSLHPVKGITTGEGGVVTTNDSVLAEKIRRLRSHGMVRDKASIKHESEAFEADGTLRPWYYEMSELGWNYRLPDILCALGLTQLSKLDRFIKQRRLLAAHYDKRLNGLNNFIRPVPCVRFSSHAFHLYAVAIDFDALGQSRTDVMNALRRRHIGTQVHYLPVHRQPYYRQLGDPLVLPGADAYYSRCLSLPLFPLMSEADVDRVCDALAEIVSQ